MALRSSTFNKKQAVFILAAGVLVLLSVELLSFVFFTVFKGKFTFYDINQFLLTDSVISFAQQGYHAQRGWDNHYDTPFGERPRAMDYNDPYIATFGDSFVHCDRVKDNETWQEYLSSMLKRDVYNFGTGGYGTDQAYLKFLEKYPKVRTPIAILGLTTENINRIVNVYRPFYFEKTGQRITKPRFEILNGKLTLLGNPITTEDEISMLKSPRFIQRIGQHDYWYNRDKYPVLKFPYIKILFNRRLWRELANKTDDIAPRPWANLWEDQETRELMFGIIDSFVADASAAGATPVIMIIPDHRQTLFKFQMGRDSDNTSKIMAYCRQKKYITFNPVDGFVEHLENGDPINQFYDGHITGDGNRIIAQELVNFLKSIDYNK